ncbi:subclass B1 metallo-beta-lactamase [uncultured Alistipes sp.]|jgi:beta-lactamase type II|uniref:subclass B1 metallo-beta-lactamase n=1 Tax=uncultured Alistipes sp. TaxID=538949 RepID=UPI0025DECFD0|nr:subclass B1 metallo-beta-lactamase [uncultured Alistipes sp.]
MPRFRLILLFSLLSATAAARTPESIDVGNDITATALAEGIYLYTAVAQIEGYGAVPSNGVIVVHNGEAVLLDTPVSDAQTKTLVDWTAEKLRARITTFVPNHWHSDCMGGLGYLKAQGVKSHAQERTRRIARHKGLPVPDTGFTDSLQLDLHGTKIRCYYFGGGHSEDNIVVWIPSEKILFAGCMVKSLSDRGPGNLSDAVPEAWPATLDSLLVRFPDARIVIPGHGAPGGLELIRHTKALLGGTIPANNPQ